MFYALTFLFLTAAALAQPSAPIKDSRDGKTYRTVKIGEQVWMAENLNYGAEKSLCYDNDEENCAKYGRLYDWETAMEACPSGWHLPGRDEWDILFNLAHYLYLNKDRKFDGYQFAGKHLKSKNGWNKYKGKSGNGTDEFGFAALPGGGASQTGFFYMGEYGFWWTATEDYQKIMYYVITSAWGRKGDKTSLLSVRCVRD